MQREVIREIVREELKQLLAEKSSPALRQPSTTKKASDEREKILSEVQAELAALKEEKKEEDEEESLFDLEISGYGDIRYSFYDYNENVLTNPEGSRSKSKSAFDLTRFVVEIEGEYEPAELGFEAEIEFEHGGTGSALELEFEEFGEFESEVENGGEVIVEELYLKKKFGDGYKVKVGRFYVGVGLLPDFYTPLDYLGTSRPEAEITVLPAVWDEIGIALEKTLDWGKLTLQVVNGLDSSAFSSARWVASGHQERFEVNRAEDLAYVARLDTRPWGEDFLLGGSVYWAPSTTKNRPTDDLDVDGGLLIVSGHSDYRWRNFRGKTFFMWGSLDDAAEISERNGRPSNNLQVARTPVGDEALGAWTELGYDLVPLFSDIDDAHRIEPFFRVDYYDTMLETSEGIFDNPRFERFVYTAGVAYTFMDAVAAKLDWSMREFEASDVDTQNTVRASFGFVY